ncbi:MAG: bacteriohemerythrin [Betaproteobacteria bacterium]|nr:bacteriohemerythrin [Betaproteobacteria bacterium]
MKTFVWSDEYSVGIAEIDEQHKTLFVMIEKLHQAIMKHEGSAACKVILAELVDYARVHFALEQTLMRVGKYPEYEEHCRLHKELVEEVEALQQKIASGRAAISFELLQFLRTWLSKHILSEDMKYGAFFKHGQSSHGNTVNEWSARSRSAMEKHKKKSAWWKFW